MEIDLKSLIIILATTIPLAIFLQKKIIDFFVISLKTERHEFKSKTKTLFYLFILINLILFSSYFINGEYKDVIENILKVSAIILFFINSWRIINLSEYGIQKIIQKSNNTIDDMLSPFITKILKLVVIIISLLLIAPILNINVAALIAGLGLGGLAFALAAKDIIQNIFGSMNIILDQNFKVGDRIIFGKYDGIVTKIGLRTTEIKTDNSIVHIPNSKFITNEIENVTTE